MGRHVGSWKIGIAFYKRYTRVQLLASFSYKYSTLPSSLLISFNAHPLNLRDEEAFILTRIYGLSKFNRWDKRNNFYCTESSFPHIDYTLFLESYRLTNISRWWQRSPVRKLARTMKTRCNGKVNWILVNFAPLNFYKFILPDSTNGLQC